CGLLRKPLSFSATRFWICSGVIPLTLTSLINGREMLPSVRTTTVWETSGSFQTLTWMTSESPTIYPDGTATAGFGTSAGFAASAGFAPSELAGPEVFRVALCVWAARLLRPAIQQRTTILIISFLYENIYLLPLSVTVRRSGK